MTQVLSPFWYRISGLKPQLAAQARVHRHRYRGEAWYVVEDPASGRHHRFTPAVFLMVGQMDGTRTVDAIWRDAVERLSDDAPTQGDVVDILSQLHAADLLRCDLTPDAAELFHRVEARARSTWKAKLLSPLSVKVPLLDPDRFLEQTLPFVAPLAGRAGLLLWLAVVLPALVLAAMHWPELSGGVLDHAFGTENLLAIALIYPFVKALHELGHGYACKAGGGPVHDLGFMFLIFIPVPYVDASSSSAFRSTARRVGVGAAGMLVETFVAGLAMIVWANVEPGLVRSLAFNVMLIAGVSTVLFNANPLMRFDGYYIFADLIEIPNLGGRSNRFWGWLADRFAFGLDAEPPPATTGERVWFLFYAPLALVYRMMLLFGIALLVATKFFAVGVALAVWSVAMGLVLPTVKYVGQLLFGGKYRRHRRRAVSVTIAAAAASLALVGVVPAPLHTMAEGVIWLPEESVVRAAENGFVRRIAAAPGTALGPGDLVLEVEDEETAASAAVLAAQIESLTARLASEDFEDRAKAALTRREIEIYRASLAQQRAMLQRLDIRSPGAGTLFLPRAADLPGRYVRRGDILGYVVAPASREARVIVPQADAELVLGRLRSVEVRLPDDVGTSLPAEVIRVVPAASRDLPSRALAVEGGGRVAVDPNDREGGRTLERLFQLDLALPPDPHGADFGSRVFVRFDVAPEPLARQWYRRLRQVFLTVLDT